jgi:hypothetical protein
MVHREIAEVKEVNLLAHKEVAGIKEIRFGTLLLDLLISL